METCKNCKVWGVILGLLFLSGCGLFRKVDKTKSSYEIKSSVDSTRKTLDSLKVQTNTVSQVLELGATTEFLGTKIYPRGTFTFSNGVFQGEADSIVTTKRKDSTNQKATNTQQQQQITATKVDESSVSSETDEKAKAAETHKEPAGIPSWFWFGMFACVILGFYTAHKLRP